MVPLVANAKHMEVYQMINVCISKHSLTMGNECADGEYEKQFANTHTNMRLLLAIVDTFLPASLSQGWTTPTNF